MQGGKRDTVEIMIFMEKGYGMMSRVIQMRKTKIIWKEESLGFSFSSQGETWEWMNEYQPYMECSEGKIYFCEAEKITHTEVENGIGKGILSHYESFVINEKRIPYAFETYVWVEEATEDIYCEWIPVNEEGLHIHAVYWPGAMQFKSECEADYTLLNIQQGLLIPNTWKAALGEIPFQGMFETAGSYMPWFAQVRQKAGYIAICETPWNAGYWAEHPEQGGYTHVGVRLEPSLGKMEYRRKIRYTFLKSCDYNDLAKVYRNYVKEQGRLRTLAEKEVQVPSVNRLIGSLFVHKGIKTSVKENSDFFDPKDPEKNNRLICFSEREQEIRMLKEKGVEKLYMHLDGWAEPGYDNQHPDYYPACREAGGWEGMKSLVDAMHECGYLFGIHDQYRDYYKDAPSFEEEYACRLTDGTIPEHRRWAGGPQSYLCATQAPYYVKRNFSRLRKHGINLDCAYLDVFTCNEGDECGNPRHRMTRRECYEERGKCFSYLLSQNILPSSEEVSDWSMPTLVFCHYAPYEFMMRKPGEVKKGIPVPLFNLVYHDCVIIPWMMERVSQEEDYMMYALLNGGAPYLIRDGAYPNTDGSFEPEITVTLEESIQRAHVVSELHERIAKCEMIRHEFLDEKMNKQRTIFSDGTIVEIDLESQSYRIYDNK